MLPCARGATGSQASGWRLDQALGSEDVTGEPPGPESYPPPPSGSAPRGIPESELYGSASSNVHAVSEAPLTSIGDISISRSQVITPAGTFPLRGSVWTATDVSRTEEYMPAYAIVLAIVFFIFCLLGLLFLLMKATRTVGFVQVSVNGGSGHYHSTMIPVSSPGHVYHVMNQVNWARSMAAQA
jgi:hypothetical protein